MSLKILCLSNGHGEDAIAIRILQELYSYSPSTELVALPLVGWGQAYVNHHIPIVGTVKGMPSGGFIYMDWRQLWRDVQNGLGSLFWSQLQTVRQWSEAGGVILAVGDIVPLGLARLSGANYAFVGTAKSEYYLRNETGWYAHRPGARVWEGWSGSVYLPWERWLMSRSRCQAVFPRDSFTAQVLRKWPIPIYNLGNPMMDHLQPQDGAKPDQAFDQKPDQKQRDEPSLVVALLPGSRAPEAYENWRLILQAVRALSETFLQGAYLVRGLPECGIELPRQLTFIAAIAPGLDPELFCQELTDYGWQLVNPPSSQSETLANVQDHIQDHPKDSCFAWNRASLTLSQHRFNDFLHQADLAIAMAGTATEQFVGLGKPAIALPGGGPQFTERFAEAQSRLLGESLLLVEDPAKVPEVVKSLLHNPDRLHQIAENGRQRMGQPGAARRIAECLLERLAPD